jgi:hypothetical protein
MDDELLIDGAGRVATQSEASRQRLGQRAGAFRLLASAPSLLVALRREGQGLFGELPQLAQAVPVLAGDVAGIPPSDVLSLLHQGRHTGVLFAATHGIERCAVLIDGQVTWAASTSPAEQQAGRAAEASTESDEVWKPLDAKALEIVFGLLAAEEGSFAFFRAPPEARLPAVFALDTQAVLLEGLRRLDEVRLYRTRVAPGMRPHRISSSLPPQGAELTPQALKLLELSDGERTVAELAAEVGLSEFAATRACYHLLISGHLRG